MTLISVSTLDLKLFPKILVLVLDPAQRIGENLMPDNFVIKVLNCQTKILKTSWKENERGYRMKPENLRRWTIHIRHLSDVPVSRNWYKTVKIIPKRIYIRFRIRVVVLNGSYSTNTQPIWKLLYPIGAWESQICSCYNFSLFILHF